MSAKYIRSKWVLCVAHFDYRYHMWCKAATCESVLSLLIALHNHLYFMTCKHLR
jgi:hypothetical protein